MLILIFKGAKCNNQFIVKMLNSYCRLLKIPNKTPNTQRSVSSPFLSSKTRSNCEFANQMDWQGQKLAEHLMQLLLVVFAVVAFITGYVLESFQTMMLVYAGGVVFTSLVTVPNWPWFNRHHLNWLDPSEAEKHPKPEPVSSAPKKKASKK